MPTASTIPLLFLGLIVWRLAKGNLTSVVLFVTVFGASSALDVGDLGIAPWIFILAIGLWFKLVTGRLDWQIPDGANRTALLLLIAFVVYAVFSAIAFPIAFKGIHVVAAHMLSGGPLAFGSNNISQTCYLLACFVVFILGLTSGRESLRSALDWYVYGCVVGAMFSAYQYLGVVANLPYPSAILYTGHHVIFSDTVVGADSFRLNSTFDEVSALAPHMAMGLVIVGWDLCTKALSWRQIAKFVVIFGSILFSESTTGYLSLILVLFSLGVLSIRVYLKAHTISRAKIGILAGVLLSGLTIVTLTDVPLIATKAFQRDVLDKDKSLSYKERTATNISAMETAKATSFIGAGLGSVRCSSLEYGMLATLGGLGCLLFATFFVMMFVPLWRRSDTSSGDETYGKALLASCVVLAAMSVSGNEQLADPTLWMLFAAGVAGPTCGRTRKAHHGGFFRSRHHGRHARNSQHEATTSFRTGTFV